MARYAKAYTPLTHGLSSNANFASTLPQATRRRKHERAFVSSRKWVASTITSPNPRIRGPAMVNVGQRAGRTRTTIGRIEGRKSLQAARVGKVNHKNNHPNLEAHASYVMVRIGYVTV